MLSPSEFTGVSRKSDEFLSVKVVIVMNYYSTSIIKVTNLTGHDSLHYKINHCSIQLQFNPSYLAVQDHPPPRFPFSCFPAHRRLEEG